MIRLNLIEVLLGGGCVSLRRLVITATLGILSACGGGDVGHDLRRIPLEVTPKATPVYDRDDLYRFFSVAFGAAPGVTYMGQLLDAANAGMSIKAIVNVFTSKPQFLETYPVTLSNQEYAQRLVENVVGTSATATAKAEAVTDIVAALSPPANWTRGDITYAIFNNLARKPPNDAQWGGTAKKMANQVVYAKYYTETIKGDSTDLEKLRSVITAVTAESIVTTQVERDILAALDLKVPSGVSVGLYQTKTVGTQTFGSSSRLQVEWQLPSGTLPNRYEVTARELTGKVAAVSAATGTATGVTLSELKAATAYSVTVTACADSLCLLSRKSTAAAGKTSTEFWQLQGTGSAVSGLTRIVSDGNARISATRFGPEAGDVTGNRIQLYYGPFLASGRHALSTALTVNAVSAALPSSYLNFESSGATTGLLTPTPASTLIQAVATGQGVPLSAAMGGKVRVFFEAQGSDRKTRIFTIDSVDGYTGQDFNTSSASKICATTADFSSGGGCVFSVAIGVEGDSVAANAKILNARQNKVGYPTQTDWRWDGAPGTFMVFTSDRVPGCSTANLNHGYAVWSGSKWDVQYDAAGCPKLFVNVQAAFPMHIGGVRYKLYYGDPSSTTGKLASTLPFLGPKRLLYGDGTNTGLNDRVDFEDWESQTNARDVVFLWPNGEILDNTAEGYIDDFHFLTPTGSLDLQVMYLAITNGTDMPIGAAAVLLNP
jgi:hypothetical protein